MSYYPWYLPSNGLNKPASSYSRHQSGFCLNVTFVSFELVPLSFLMVHVRLVHPTVLTLPDVCSLYTTEPKFGVISSHYPLFKGGDMWDCQGMGYPLAFFRVSGVQCDLFGIRKALAAVDMYVLPVVVRGQGRGLTLPFQTEISRDFYSFSSRMLRA